jgi:hypothetical protein
MLAEPLQREEPQWLGPDPSYGASISIDNAAEILTLQGVGEMLGT